MMLFLALSIAGISGCVPTKDDPSTDDQLLEAQEFMKDLNEDIERERKFENGPKILRSIQNKAKEEKNPK